ncbi:MAG: allantoicase [Acidobacteria bacterium]|nr:allantoicase [Acidobacteriota bacterium]
MQNSKKPGAGLKGLRSTVDTAEAGADDSTPAFSHLADLASARVGGRPIATNDDFFASKSNLVKPEPAIFIAGKYTARGKWMDGWESRRRRTPGHDWCIVKLGMRGCIRGVDVDTSFFTGNFPPECSIDAIDAAAGFGVTAQMTSRSWTTILPRTSLTGDSRNFLAVAEALPWTHVRLNIFPDGGVARLRVYGDVVVDWARVAPGRRAVDLAALRHGGLVLAASDVHYGAKDNMLMPGRASNMGDGWETKRRRGPGHDWAIVRLGAPGVVTKLEIDTNHFKGNYPDQASVEGVFAPSASIEQLSSEAWREVLPASKLRAHNRHFFAKELRHRGPVSHLRLNLFPDGGVSRFRVHGTRAR